MNSHQSANSFLVKNKTPHFLCKRATPSYFSWVFMIRSVCFSTSLSCALLKCFHKLCFNTKRTPFPDNPFWLLQDRYIYTTYSIPRTGFSSYPFWNCSLIDLFMVTNIYCTSISTRHLLRTKDNRGKYR